MWALLREVSIRHLRHALLRTALVIFGIALGVSMLSAVLAANASLLVAFHDIVDRVAGQADLMVSAGSAGLPASLTAETAEVEGVAHAAATAQVVTRTKDGQGGPVLVLGVDFLGDTFFLPFAQPGERQVVSDPLAFVNDAHAVLVAKKFARTHQLTIDSPLVLLTPEGEQTFYVRGLLEDEGPAASFGGQVVVMFVDALQIAFGRGDLVDRTLFRDDSIDAAELFFQPGMDPERAAQQVRAHLGASGSLFVTLQKGMREQFKAVSANVFALARAPELITLLVAMMGVIGTMFAAVLDRVREIGLLRAVGATRRQVVISLAVEGAFLGLAAALCGIAAGVPQGYLFLKVTGVATTGWDLPYAFPLPSALRLGAEILIGAALAGWLPGVRAARLEVGDALAYE